jgi:hypothetical protein
MSDFKVGDVVRHGSEIIPGDEFEVGAEYVVAGQSDFDEEYVRIEGHPRSVAPGGPDAGWWKRRFELVSGASTEDEVTRVIHPDMLDEGEVIIVNGVRRRVDTSPIPGAAESFFKADDDGWWNLPVDYVHLVGDQFLDQDQAKAIGLQVRVQARRVQS